MDERVFICRECEREIKKTNISAKDSIALNKKLLNRQITSFFCASCLAKYLEIEESDLPELVERFKEQGCKLF